MSSDWPGPAGSQEACFSDVTNEEIYNAYCTLLEKVKGEDRRISVKEKSEKFDCFALKSNDSQCAFQTTESGASRLVRTSAKAVHPHGSDEAGIASDFKSFLKGKSKELEIVSFRGNRFNILFYDAGALYYHWDDLYELLTS